MYSSLNWSALVTRRAVSANSGLASLGATPTKPAVLVPTPTIGGPPSRISVILTPGVLTKTVAIAAPFLLAQLEDMVLDRRFGNGQVALDRSQARRLDAQPVRAAAQPGEAVAPL